MKKFLVLSLVLVLALAGSVFAADEAVEEVVEPKVPVLVFNGEFGAKVAQNTLTWGEDADSSFKVLQGDANFSHYIVLNMGSSSDTWSLKVNFAEDEAGKGLIALDGDAGYTLKVNDDLFGLTVWQGADNSQGFVRDPFALVQGRDKNAAATVRLNVPVMDVANVKLQLEPNSSVVAHVTGDISGAELGLIAQRKFHDTVLRTDEYDIVGYEWVRVPIAGSDPVDYEWDEVPVLADLPNSYATIENALDTVVLHGAYDFEVVKVSAAAGLSINNTKEPAGYDELNNTDKHGTTTTGQLDMVDSYLEKLENAFAFGAKVEAPITEEIKAEASYVLKQNDWKGNLANSAVATVKGSYETDELEVNANFSTTGKHKNIDDTTDNRTTTFGADGTYNFTDDMNVKLAAKHTIEKDKDARIEDNINTTNITASVAAPIVEGLVSVNANLGYTFDNLGAIQVGKYAYDKGAWPVRAATRGLTSFALAKTVFEAGASVKITPMAKLTVTPAVTFKSFKDGNKDVDEVAAIRALRDATWHGAYNANNFTAGSILTFKADATYAIGGGATLTLSAGQNNYSFTEVRGLEEVVKYNNPFASAAVKVVF